MPRRDSGRLEFNMPVIQMSADGLPCVTLAAHDSAVLHVRRQRNAFVAIAAILAVALAAVLA